MLIRNSVPTGSRKMRTVATSMSSIAQPVTAIDPATPVMPSVGVSNTPIGAVDVPFGVMVKVTLMVAGATAVGAPVNVIVTEPLTVPDAGSPAAGCTPIERDAGIVLEFGVTVIQGWFGVAIQMVGAGTFC